MAFIINDDGSLSVEPPPGSDPVRQANADLAERLAWFLEMSLQADESNDARIMALTQRVEFLEAMIAAPAPAARPARGRLCAHAGLDGQGMHWLEAGETCHRVVPQ